MCRAGLRLAARFLSQKEAAHHGRLLFCTPRSRRREGEKGCLLQEGRENKRVCVLGDLLASVEGEGFARAYDAISLARNRMPLAISVGSAVRAMGTAAHGVASTLKINDETDWRFRRGVDNRGDAFESRWVFWRYWCCCCGQGPFGLRRAVWVNFYRTNTLSDELISLYERGRASFSTVHFQCLRA